MPTKTAVSRYPHTEASNGNPKNDDSNQIGFLKGSSISESFIFAAELVQCCHKRKTPLSNLTSRRHSTVHWEGLQTILQVSGFNDLW